jgi:hypothetical protein
LVKANTLITPQEIFSSRLKMVEQAKNGTSIKLQEPSEVDQPTSLSKSNPQATPTNSNTTAPTQNGGNSSSTEVDISPMSRTRR